MTVMAQETTYPLSDLVRRRRAELGLSLRKFADRCIDPDTGEQELKYGIIDRLERREAVTPFQLPELRALAAALQLPLGDVQDAAGEQFLGIRTRDIDADHRIRMITTRAMSLDDAGRDRLLAIADALLPTEPTSEDNSK
jgi:transcriptional regulator with XRE-family HTH domain